MHSELFSPGKAGRRPEGRAFLSIVLVSLTACQTNRLSKDDIEPSLKENLSAGAKVSEVTRFLDSRRIEHFGHEEGMEPVFAPSPAQPSPEISRYVLAKIPNVRRKLLARWDLYIIFFFDDKGSMTHYKLKEVGTG